MHNFYNLNPNHNARSPEESASISLDINVPLHNDAFNLLFDAYCADPSEITQNDLGSHLNKMYYLLGLISDEPTSDGTVTKHMIIKKGDDLKFLICSNDNREVYLPLFTNDTELKAWHPEPINTLTVPAEWLWKFILSQKNYAGVMINPIGIAWAINLDQIQSLLNDIE